MPPLQALEHARHDAHPQREDVGVLRIALVLVDNDEASRVDQPFDPPQRLDQPVAVGGEALVVELIGVEREKLSCEGLGECGAIRPALQQADRVEVDADREQDVA